MNRNRIRNGLTIFLLLTSLIGCYQWNKERQAVVALELQKNYFRARLYEEQAGESSNPALRQRLALEALALPLPPDKIPVNALSLLISHADNALAPELLWRSPVAGTTIYYGLDFQPNGNLLATGASDPLVRLWDTTTGYEVSALSGHENVVTTVRFHPDGKLLASGSHDGSIRLWNLPDGSEEAQLAGHEKGVLCLAFSSNGKLLASGSQDRTVRIWDLKTRQTISQFTGHEGMVLDVLFSNADKYLLSAAQDNSIRIWDVASGKLKDNMIRHRAVVQGIAASPDGKTIASGDAGGTLMIWQTDNPSGGQSIAAGSEIADLLFEEDGHFLLVGTSAGQIQRWNLQTRHKTQEWLAHYGGINALARHPSGLLASSGLDKTIRLWDAGGAEQARLSGHHRDILSLALSSNGSLLASGSLDREIRIWDTRSGLEMALLQGHSAEILAMEFSPGSELLLSASADHSLRLWQLPDGKVVHTSKSHTGTVHCLAWHAGSGLLASGSADRTVKIWRIQDKSLSEQMTIKGYAGEVVSIAFTSDGKHLYSASRDGRLKIHDPLSGRLIREWQDIPVDYWQSRFQDNGRAFVTAANDSTIELYNLSGNEAPRRFYFQGKPVRSIALNSRKHLLAAADSDGRITCFDIRSAKPLLTWKPHHRDIWQLLFAAPANTLLSAGRDNQLALWELPPPPAEMPRETRLIHGFFSDAEDRPRLAASIGDSLQLLDGRSGRKMQAIHAPALAGNMAFRASPARLVCYGTDGKLTLLELPALNRRSLEAPVNWTTISLSADGSSIAGCSQAGELTVLDAPGGNRRFSYYLPNFARGLSFQPDGSRLAVDCGSGEFFLFNSKDGSILRRSAQTGETILSTNGEMAVLLPNNQILLQNAESGESVGYLPGRVTKIGRMAFSASGQLLATATGGHTPQVEIWDVERHLVLASVSLPAQTGTAAILDLVFAVDGESLFYRHAGQLAGRLDISILSAYLNAGPEAALLKERRHFLDARYGFIRSEEGIREHGPAQFLVPVTPSALTAGKALRDLLRPGLR